VLLHLALFVLGESAALHDLPDALLGVARHDVVGDHLVVDDVRLELDALAACRGRVVDHLERLGEAALVVDPDLGDDERRCVRSDPTSVQLEGAHAFSGSKNRSRCRWNRCSATWKSSSVSMSPSAYKGSVTSGNTRSPKSSPVLRTRSASE